MQRQLKEIYIETFNIIINDISTMYTEFATYTGEEYMVWPVEHTCDPVDVEMLGTEESDEE